MYPTDTKNLKTKPLPLTSHSPLSSRNPLRTPPTLYLSLISFTPPFLPFSRASAVAVAPLPSSPSPLVDHGGGGGWWQRPPLPSPPSPLPPLGGGGGRRQRQCPLPSSPSPLAGRGGGGGRWRPPLRRIWWEGRYQAAAHEGGGRRQAACEFVTLDVFRWTYFHMFCESVVVSIWSVNFFYLNYDVRSVNLSMWCSICEFVNLICEFKKKQWKKILICEFVMFIRWKQQKKNNKKKKKTTNIHVVLPF